jgi:hypothetical protein
MFRRGTSSYCGIPCHRTQFRCILHLGKKPLLIVSLSGSGWDPIIASGISLSMQHAVFMADLFYLHINKQFPVFRIHESFQNRYHLAGWFDFFSNHCALTCAENQELNFVLVLRDRFLKTKGFFIYLQFFPSTSHSAGNSH